MRYLLDTNVLSELRKEGRGNRGVKAWALAHDPAQSAISVASAAEIRCGIENVRSTDPQQAEAIERWLDGLLVEFAANLLPVTGSIADRWGRLMSATDRRDRDLLLAATALEHDLTVVTRNDEDFRGTGVRIHNPWK